MPTVITILSLILVGWGFGAVLCVSAKTGDQKIHRALRDARRQDRLKLMAANSRFLV